MKKSLKVAHILSWFNLFFWGIPLVINLLNTLLAFNPLILGAVVLFCSIPLHSYAALQLHKSIRRPEVKLSHNTPAGIRFVGLIALFFGFFFLVTGMAVARNTSMLLDMLREQGPYKDMYAGMSVGDLRKIGIMVIVLGLIIIVNVVLNLRLLRWYYLVRQSDAS